MYVVNSLTDEHLAFLSCLHHLPKVNSIPYLWHFLWHFRTQRKLADRVCQTQSQHKYFDTHSTHIQYPLTVEHLAFLSCLHHLPKVNSKTYLWHFLWHFRTQRTLAYWVCQAQSQHKYFDTHEIHIQYALTVEHLAFL